MTDISCYWSVGALPTTTPTPFKNLPNRAPTGVAPPYSGLWDPQFLLTYYSARPVSWVSCAVIGCALAKVNAHHSWFLCRAFDASANVVRGSSPNASMIVRNSTSHIFYAKHLYISCINLRIFNRPLISCPNPRNSNLY